MTHNKKQNGCASDAFSTRPFAGRYVKKTMNNFLKFIISLYLSINLSSGYAMELPEEIHSKIEILSAQGKSLAESGKHREATEKFIEALQLLPEPITNWEACTRLLVAIGDMNFLQRAYEQAKIALSDAMHCPNALGNPFIHLRLGQSQFELGNKERAADELSRAYMGAGKEIFEEGDPKYFEFLKTVLKPPANEKW